MKKYNIGDTLEVFDFCQGQNRYVKVKIIDIINKVKYNMYLCKNLKSGCKITFTDLDEDKKVRVKNNSVKILK